MQAAPPLAAASAADLVEQFHKTEGLNDRIGILRQLVIVGREESVPLLEKLLEHEDSVIRQYALAAAEANPSPAAGAALVGALAKAQDGAWKVALINAVGSRRESTAVGPLGGLAADPDAAVAAAAIAALGNIGTMQAGGVLVRVSRRLNAGELTADKDQAWRMTFDLAKAMTLCRDRVWAGGEAQGTGFHRGMSPFSSAQLTSAEVPPYLRLAIIRGLVQAGDLSKALNFALTALKNGGAREQAEAARILIDLQDEDLVTGPKDPKQRFVDVQKRLLESLPQLPPTAQAFLLEALAEREARAAAKKAAS